MASNNINFPRMEVEKSISQEKRCWQNVYHVQGKICMLLLYSKLTLIGFIPTCLLWGFLHRYYSCCQGVVDYYIWYSFPELFPAAASLFRGPVFYGSIVAPVETLISDEVTPPNSISWFYYNSEINCHRGYFPNYLLAFFRFTNFYKF